MQKAFEQGTGLSSSGQLIWQENQKSFINQSLVFEESSKLRIKRTTEWDELIRKRKQLTFSHEVAQVFEHQFVFEWDKGLELVTQDCIPWEKSHPIYYRKHVIEPWPDPEIPEYVGSNDLTFNCLCNDVDSHNGISLTNDKTGATGLVTRTGTSGDVLLETVNNNLFTSASVMGAFGKSALAKAGMVEMHTFTMPLTQKIGLCKPADILAFNAEWWGIVDSISGSFSYSKVTQTVTVERVNHE